MSSYAIKSVYDTVWGDGARTGHRSVVVRFSDCNLWDGHPLHRQESGAACALYCDSDHLRGTVMDLDELLAAMERHWPAERSVLERNKLGQLVGTRWCVLTGGEPMLHLDVELVDALHDSGWAIAVETNGTLPHMASLSKCDHVCVSPKYGVGLKLHHAHELRVVLPGVVEGVGWTFEQLAALSAEGEWGALYVQPQDPLVDPKLVGVTALTHSRENVDDEEAAEQAQLVYKRNLRRCLDVIDWCPSWRLSAQLGKLLPLG